MDDVPLPDRAVTPARSASAVLTSWSGVNGMPAMRGLFVLLGMVLLWTLATLLSHEYHERRTSRGQRAAMLGDADLRADRHAAAAAHFREAVVLEPDRDVYRLSLAKALVAAQQGAEAEPYVRDVLRQNPVHGEANLVLARIARTKGDRVEAESAYYRAIYGRWLSGQQALRVQARLELVSLFEETADHSRVRVALGELAGAFPGDLALQQHAARQLLAFGFTDEAARLLHGVVDRFAAPGDALSMLAEAEFARGHYIEAFDAARRASERRPADLRAAQIRDLASQVLSLDPAQPRLSTRARAGRVQILLTQARARVLECRRSMPLDERERAIVDLADRWLARRAQQPADIDLGYTTLEALSGLVRLSCPASAPDDAVGLVVARLGSASRP